MTKGTFIEDVVVLDGIIIPKGERYTINNGFMVIGDADIMIRTGTPLFNKLNRSTKTAKKNG